MIVRLLYLLIIFFCGYGIARAENKYDKLFFITVLISVVFIRFMTRGAY